MSIGEMFHHEHHPVTNKPGPLDPLWPDFGPKLKEPLCYKSERAHSPLAVVPQLYLFSDLPNTHKKIIKVGQTVSGELNNKQQYDNFIC